MKIIMISGKQGSGKSTLTNYLFKKLNGTNIACMEFRFAEVIYSIHDYARNKLKECGVEIPDSVKIKDGPLLQWLGTEWGRKTIADDVWVRCVKGRIDNFDKALASLTRNTHAIISDCRFRNEFDAFPEALRIRLDCPKTIRQARVEMWRPNDVHPSEIDLDGYVYDGKFDLVMNSHTSSVEEIGERIIAHLSKDDWQRYRKI